jgi:ornithine cyclodeaminase
MMLDKHQVERLLDKKDVLDAVQEAFTLHSQDQGRVFPVVREALDTGGIFGIKAGDVQSQALLGFKAAGFWPSNRAAGGEPHQATIVLIDPATGRPVCIIDGNAITTARTGAAGCLALMNLAAAGSENLCVFGTGVQAAIQLEFALDALPSIRKVSYVSYNDEADAAFEKKFAARCALAHARDRNDAVSRSDVVITATPGGGALFDEQAVRPGTHINAVGADTKGKRELPDGLLRRARLFVDDQPQARQLGESQWAADVPSIELGDVLTGKAKVERRPEDITVMDMTGLALQDLTVARMLHRRAEADNSGTRLAWPW